MILLSCLITGIFFLKIFFLSSSKDDALESNVELVLIDNGELTSDIDDSESEEHEDVEDNEINDLEPSSNEDLAPLDLFFNL